MWKKKPLIIVFVVTLAIFGGSLAFGLPWWQALLISIVFLLVISLIFSGSGLLIPEALFSIRSPSRRVPEEAEKKEDFLKRMDSELAEFSAQPQATTDDIHWMTEYTRVMKGVGELVYTVHESVGSKDRARQLWAFREAVNDLPRLVSQFKAIPELEVLEKTMERQEEGLDLYLAACSDFAEAIEKNDGELAGQAAKQINQALDLLNIIQKPASASRW